MSGDRFTYKMSEKRTEEREREFCARERQQKTRRTNEKKRAKSYDTENLQLDL